MEANAEKRDTIGAAPTSQSQALEEADTSSGAATKSELDEESAEKVAELMPAAEASAAGAFEDADLTPWQPRQPLTTGVARDVRHIPTATARSESASISATAYDAGHRLGSLAHSVADSLLHGLGLHMEEEDSWEIQSSPTAPKENATAAVRPALSNSKSIAMIVPFRDRGKHLVRFKESIARLASTWVNYSFTIVVVEQYDNALFNRGYLFNAGFQAALASERPFDCVVIHDVDLLPEPNVDYGQCEWPTQLSGEISCWHDSVPYKESAGGVLSMSPVHWKRINGFSNEYAGWGGEDDDIYLRMKQNHLLHGGCHTFCAEKASKSIPMVVRPPLGTGKFSCLHDDDHTPRERTKDDKAMNSRLKEMRMASGRWRFDGLSSMSVHRVGPDATVAPIVAVDSGNTGGLIKQIWLRVSQDPIESQDRIRLVLPDTHTACAGETASLTTIPFSLKELRDAWPRAFRDECGVRPDEAQNASFVLFDPALGKVLLVGQQATDVSGSDEVGMQDQRLSKWIRHLPAGHKGLVMMASAPLPAIRNYYLSNKRHIKTPYPVCISSFGTKRNAEKKYRASPGAKFCGDGGWTSESSFDMLKTKEEIPEDKVLPLCISYENQTYTYRFEQSEDCTSKLSQDMEKTYTHLRTVYTTKDADGDHVCVGFKKPDRWIIQQNANCNTKGFAHQFTFRAMSTWWTSPLVRGCLLAAEPLSTTTEAATVKRLALGEACEAKRAKSSQRLPDYSEWRIFRDNIIFFAKQQSPEDKQLCVSKVAQENHALLQEAAHVESEQRTWRNDTKCGIRGRLETGEPGECNPTGEFPCCSLAGWCGKSPQHCRCSGCTDYRRNTVLWVEPPAMKEMRMQMRMMAEQATSTPRPETNLEEMFSSDEVSEDERGLVAERVVRDSHCDEKDSLFVPQDASGPRLCVCNLRVAGEEHYMLHEGVAHCPRSSPNDTAAEDLCFNTLTAPEALRGSWLLDEIGMHTAV
eukprot:gnl/TRDRNA2_/TRDRNA2_163422_c1_seq2.p1 gnl/TRDRNA2_/TRDRNA2_163422_c1~~gnl/TRDRNA2_/TRDRNA2_163422_c1_seq2.p1  ORF type:complete len:1074 (+),score=210.53 gnl/TRDRNA2_/TRDRNA2_163422_c1_seq2:289-3222(+)